MAATSSTSVLTSTGEQLPDEVKVMRSPILALPLEIRLMIYTYTLFHPLEQIALYNLHDEHVHRLKGRNYPTLRHRFCANILKTCRQIKQEATPILYGENLFACHPSLLSELPSLLLAIRPVHIVLPPVLYTHLTSQIRRFYMLLRLDTDPGFNREKVERSFSGADELRLELSEAMYGASDLGVLRMFEGVRGVKKARVYGSVSSERDYTQWLTKAMMAPIGMVVTPYTDAKSVVHEWNLWSDGNR